MATKKGVKQFPGKFAHWAGLAVGNGLLLMVIIFILGEGFPRISFTWTEIFAWGSLLLAFAGILAGWKWDKLAGWLILAGIFIFYINNYLSVGKFPSGWVFPLFFLAGLLHLAAGWLKK